MKLTIDTQVDTHEDIRKVLHILTSILERKDTSSPATDTTPLMGMFSQDSNGTSGNAPDFGSFLNLAEKKSEKKDDKPEIEYY